jgi:ubiquinone/menaquinone biosynthesis C-methylase UbiE
MLGLARERTSDPEISYLQAFAEDAELPVDSADVVVSILALHYVADFQTVIKRIARWLVAGGTFVLVVDHPVFTAPNPPTEFLNAGRSEMVWPLNHYFDEGVCGSTSGTSRALSSTTGGWRRR